MRLTKIVILQLAEKMILCLSMTISISDNDDAVDHVVKVIVTQTSPCLVRKVLRISRLNIKMSEL